MLVLQNKWYTNGFSKIRILAFLFPLILTGLQSSRKQAIFTYSYQNACLSGVQISHEPMQFSLVFVDWDEKCTTPSGVLKFDCNCHPRRSWKIEANLWKTKVKSKKTVFRISANTCARPSEQEWGTISGTKVSYGIYITRYTRLSWVCHFVSGRPCWSPLMITTFQH